MAFVGSSLLSAVKMASDSTEENTMLQAIKIVCPSLVLLVHRLEYWVFVSFFSLFNKIFTIQINLWKLQLRKSSARPLQMF